MVTSPVISPTSLKSFFNYRYFWFERALIGEVYITRDLSRMHTDIAYSAIAVLPADVCAQTKMLSFDSIARTAFCWNGSSVNLYFLALHGPLYTFLS